MIVRLNTAQNKTEIFKFLKVDFYTDTHLKTAWAQRSGNKASPA